MRRALFSLMVLCFLVALPCGSLACTPGGAQPSTSTGDGKPSAGQAPTPVNKATAEAMFKATVEAEIKGVLTVETPQPVKDLKPNRTAKLGEKVTVNFATVELLQKEKQSRAGSGTADYTFEQFKVVRKMTFRDKPKNGQFVLLIFTVAGRADNKGEPSVFDRTGAIGPAPQLSLVSPQGIEYKALPRSAYLSLEDDVPGVKRLEDINTNTTTPTRTAVGFDVPTDLKGFKLWLKVNKGNGQTEVVEIDPELDKLEAPPDPMARLVAKAEGLGYPDDLQISGDGEYILTRANKQATLFRVVGDELQKVWSAGSAEAISLSRDGRFAAVAVGNTIHVYGNQSNSPLWNAEAGPAGGIRTVVVMEGGEAVLNGPAMSGRVSLLRKGSPRPVWSAEMASSQVAVSQDGQTIAVSSGRDGLFLLDPTNGKTVWSKKGTTGRLAMSDNGSFIAVCAGQSLLLVSKGQDSPLWEYRSSETMIERVAISSDGGSIVAAGGGKPQLFFFDKGSGQPKWSYAGPTVMAVNGDGSLVVAPAGLSGNRIFAFGRDSNQPLWEFEAAGASGVNDLAVSRDGQRVAALAGNGTLFLFRGK